MKLEIAIMLTRRGWWFFVILLVVLVFSLWSGTPTVSVACLTLLGWFLCSWLLFQIRTILVQGRMRIVRQLADENGPVQSLWAGRAFQVRVRLVSDAFIGLPYVRVQERLPYGVKR